MEPRLRALCAGPLFRALAHDLIGPDVRLYWDQAVYKQPGAREPFPWHQDNGYTFIEPQQYLTCWIALSDATEDNGCPWVVPGLHRGGTLAHTASELGFVCFETPPAPAVAVAARAGSIVVFSSLTPHATGPNRSAAARKAYIVQFAPHGAQCVREDGAGGCSTNASSVCAVRIRSASHEVRHPRPTRDCLSLRGGRPAVRNAVMAQPRADTEMPHLDFDSPCPDSRPTAFRRSVSGDTTQARRTGQSGLQSHALRPDQRLSP